MNEFFTDQECSLYSFWLVASLPQFFPHLVRYMKYHPSTYNRVHCTVEKFPNLLYGNSAFAPVHEAVKRWHRKYGQATLRYSIVLHGRRGAPKGHIKYMLGCYIDYISDDELRISHINRKVPAFVAMIRSSRFYGGVFEQETATVEQRFANAKRRMLEKKVLRS